VIESHGEDDVKASIESWEAHLKRSQSIIVDLMHGQFKSTVKCPEGDCNHVSITFEAFNNISLPIPELKLINQSFTWVPYEVGKECSIHDFQIKSTESIPNLRKYLVKGPLAN
jgi:ubiquitin carboxyl-terminal hydrolase 4/11/15